MFYIDYVLSKKSSNEDYSTNVEIPFVKSLSDDLYRLVFAPDPVTGIPISDLVLLSRNNLSPEVYDAISKLSMQQVTSSNKPFDTDKAAFDSIVPYYIDNETQLVQYYKAKGYDTTKIEQALHGDEIDWSADNDSDDSSSE